MLLLTQNVWANDLTQADSDWLVQEIDNICGDTWCEGDYNFSFNSLTCDFSLGECEMKFEVIDTLYDSDWNDVGEVRTPATCVIAAESRDVLVNTHWNTYSDYFYETMSECVSDAESDAASNRP